MRMIAPFEVLLIIGITQGFVISGLIWINKERSAGKLLLSLVLTVFNLLCIRIIILTGGLWQTQFFRYLPLAFDLAMQPLIWLYILSLTKPGFKLSKVHLIHFIPFAISIAYSSFIYIAVMPQKELVAKDAIANSFYFNNVKETEDFLSVISAIIYWWLGLRLVIRYRSWLYNNISNTDYPTYKWLKNVALLMGILIAGLTTDIILDYFFHFGTRHFLHWQVFFTYLAVLIYYLGFRGYQLHDKQIVVAKNECRQEELAFQDKYQETSIDKALPETFEVPITLTDEEIKLSEERNQQVKEAILKALETNELYLDPELNLNKLSKEIHFRPVIVSSVINSSFQMSFRNLINEYRVKKVKERFKDPASKQLSILGIAYECGFNSEASFYRIFKAEVGITPKEYIKRLQSST